MLKKIGYFAAGFIVVTLAALAGHYLFGLATGTRFTSGQWAAAGAWLSGLMTFGAVSVAVWQTRNANAQARSAESRARWMQEDLTKQRLRTEELESVRDMNRAPDMLVHAFLDFLDTTKPLLESGAPEDVQEARSLQRRMQATVAESIRIANLAFLSFETPQVTEQAVALLTTMDQLKDIITELLQGASEYDETRQKVAHHVGIITEQKALLVHAARKTHASDTVYEIVGRLTREAQQRASESNPGNS